MVPDRQPRDTHRIGPIRSLSQGHSDKGKRPPPAHLAGPGVSQPQPPEEGCELGEGGPAGGLPLSPCPLHAPWGPSSAPRPAPPSPRVCTGASVRNKAAVCWAPLLPGRLCSDHGIPGVDGQPGRLQRTPLPLEAAL